MKRKRLDSEIKQDDSRKNIINTFTLPQRDSIRQVLDYLSEVDLETEDNFHLITKNILYIHALKCEMYALKRFGLLLPENILPLLKIFLQNKYWHSFDNCVVYLYQYKLLTQENYNLLIQLPNENFDNIYCGMIYLENNKILTQNNFAFIMQKPKYAPDLAQVIAHLSKKSLMTDEIIGLLHSQAQHAIQLAISFKLLEKNESLDTKVNYMTLFKHAKDIWPLSWILPINPNQQNFDKTILYRDFSKNICEQLLEYVRKNQPITQAILDSIILNIDKQMIEERIAFLMGKHPRLGEKSSLKSFFKNPICDKKNITKQIFDFLPKPRRF